MRKIFKKAIVFAITASFVFNSGLGQMLSYAQTSDIYKNAKSIISNFATENIVKANYNVATANNVSASSDDSLTFGDFTYAVSYPSDVRIIGYTGKDTEITIPSEIDGMKVTAIGILAFNSCSSLTSITIPEGVTIIDQAAFNGCSALKNITIPKSVTTIEDNAFYGCSSLTSITIPEGVTSIEPGLFMDCSSLASVTIPKSVTNIWSYAFYGCSSLTSITIPENTTTISEYTFWGCKSLKNVTIPESVTTIESNAFYLCTSITSITIPESVTTIGYNAFSCTSITSITIPEGVTSLDGTFSGCESLTSITIPKSVTSLDGTFDGCISLTSITIPESVTTIGNSTFARTALTSITIPESVTTIGSSVFRYCTALTDITLPKSLTSIGNNAFEKCTALKNITIPENVTSIGSSVFYGCNLLESIIIPEGVASIRSSAFEGCTSLVNVTLPKSLTSVGDKAFYGCTLLKNITIPENVTSIGDRAFCKCKSLNNITLPENLDSIGSKAFNACSGLKSIKIPESVYSIGDNAFNGCSSLTNVDILGYIHSIKTWTFMKCTSLTSITLPEGLVSIGSSAFEGCSALANIKIPESVTNISDGAFANCSALTSINIPNEVTYIGSSAFYGCSSLKDITINSGTTIMKEYTFPKNTDFIFGQTFYGCSSLTSMTLPEGVTTIYEGAFSGCTNLKNIYMPRSVETIYDDVFKNCPNLTMHVYKGSESETYAIENNIPYVYRDYDDAIIILPGVMGSRMFSDTDGYGEDSLIWEPLVKDDVMETYYNLKGLSDRLLSDTYVKPLQIQQFLKAHEDSQEFFGLEYREYGALDTYKNLVDELCESTDRPVYFFSYNWMQSNSDSADKLKEFIDQFEHVDLVCHSMGGIVASSYMSKYKSDGKVDKIVTCGTPYEGSPGIINKMQNWDILADNDNFIFTDSTLEDVGGDALLGLLGGLTKETKTKITTAAELVPSENYVSRVPMYKKGILFSQLISLDEYKTICKNIFKEKYDDGLIFQEAIKGSTGYNNLLNYDKAYFLIGTNQKTIASIVFDKSDDIDSLVYEDDLKYDSKGDGTVPYISATMCQAVMRLPEDRYCFADGSHTQIVQKAKTIKWIKEKLEIDDETSTPSDDTTLSQAAVGSGFMVLRVACPVDVNIEANGEALNSSVSGFDTQTSFGRLDIIGQNDDIKMACIDTSDDYDVTLNGTDEGTMDYTIRYFNSDDELQSETTINDVPITKDTIITTKPVSTEDTVLNVDIDGDGTVDKTYTAPKGETVDVEKVVKFDPNNGDQKIKKAVDSDGKLNYTPEVPTKAGYTFVGWFKDTDDITTEYKSGSTYTEDVTYTAKWAHVDMLGAQVKAVVDDKSGIRFGTKIYNDGDEIVEKGTIILPARLLPNGESLTLDTLNIARSVGKVNYEVNEEENYVTYLGTLVGIPSSQFDAEITASSYVIYKDKKGNEYKVYSPYKKGSTTVNTLLNSK